MDSQNTLEQQTPVQQPQSSDTAESEPNEHENPSSETTSSQDKLKSSSRFVVCQNCDSFYQRSEPELHSCIRSLKDKVVNLENTMSDMLTQEQVAQILSGYVPLQAFHNFVRSTETKFSELFMMQGLQEEQIKKHEQTQSKLLLQSQQLQPDEVELTELRCPNSHPLKKLTGPRLLLITCDVCTKKAVKTGSYAMNCAACDYDICTSCEALFEDKQCPGRHALNIHEITGKNICTECNRKSPAHPDFKCGLRCNLCSYTLCNTCIYPQIEPKLNQNNAIRSFFSKNK